MKLLISLLLISLTYHAYSMGIFRPRTPEVSLPPVEVVKPTKPETKTEAAYKDADCGQMVPENFSQMVVEAVSGKPALIAHNGSSIYWTAFFKALAKAESCLKPTARYAEKGLGKDSVTGQQNTSEGFFQMSYQDAKIHGCNFDWSLDKSKTVNDPAKTIFQTKNQIECAAIVLNKQMIIKPDIYRGYYWSVLDSKTASRKEAHARFKKFLKTEGF